jgi:hypothetical protein
MSDYISCDNCGKLSPDKDGMHIGNRWVSVIASWTSYGTKRNMESISYQNKKEFIYCNDCFPPEKNSKKFLQQILGKFKSFCGLRIKAKESNDNENLP